MADLHITRELLRAVARGELAPGVIARLGLQHLMHVCPTCRREISAYQRERSPGGASDYSRAFQLLPALLEEQAPRLELEERGTLRDLEELIGSSRERRLEKVERARSRFRSAALVRKLIDESRKHLPGDPDEAFHLAELARRVAHRNPGMHHVFELIALATAYMANARRAAGQLREAEEHFGHARSVITHHGVTDTDVLARVDELEGSLRKDQRLFQAAQELLARAAMLYRVAGSRVEGARVLLKLADLHFYRGDVSRAITTVEEALRKLPADAGRRLELCGRHNLAFYLTEAGEFAGAAALVARDEALYAAFPDAWTQLRLAWLRARIAAGLGQSDTAEQIFLTTRDGFVAQGIGYDAAMISLELALLYVREGRMADVKRLAEEMYPIFQAQDVHREAAAALTIFQEAARREELTFKAIQKYVRFLRDARGDPSLRFEQEAPG